MPARRRPHGLIFDEAPSLYDRYRPGYPRAALDDLVSLTDASPGDPALEVGGGTGQLTMPLLARGLDVTVLEPAPRMAALLGRRISPYGDHARVLHQRLETAELPAASFALVASATAFHWVDPEGRYVLAARVLRPNGTLALIRNDHVRNVGNQAYHDAVAPLYERFAPELGPYLAPLEADVRGFADEVAASELFEIVAERRYGWDQEYTSGRLTGLLRTYSNHRALPRRRRRLLLDAIAELIDREFGGIVVDRYVTTLCLSRLRSVPEEKETFEAAVRGS